MERAGTILLRASLFALPLGLLVMVVALSPDGFGEARIAGVWYVGRQIGSGIAVPLLAGLAVLAGLAWVAVALAGSRRFSQQMERGAVPARRVDTRSEEELVQSARALLEPELAAARPRVERALDALLGTPVDLGAAELVLAPEGMTVDLHLRFGMEQLLVTTMPRPLFEEVLERLRLIVGVDEEGQGTVELRGSDGTEWIDVHITRVSGIGPGVGEPENAGRDDGAWRVQLCVGRRSGYSRTLEELGMPEPVLAAFGAALEQERGLVVVAGPPSAGLTTTIYAAAYRVHRARSQPDALVAVEPHVRLELPFMRQVEVGGGVAAAVLRATLGAAHEVVIVRQVRDAAPAALVARAAQKRLLLVTVEADGLLEGLSKLAGLAEAKLHAGAFLLGEGQRLLPRLCPACREPAEPTAAECELIAEYGDGGAGTFYRAAGCSACDGRGVTDEQVPLFWTIEPTAWLQTAIARGGSAAELSRLARDKGLLGPIPAGIELAREGSVALSDVLDLVGGRW